MRRFVALALFAFCVFVALGCGDSAPTVNTAPTDKQKQKEQGAGPGPGAGQKK
ncbi:hypothetical protein GobsT_15630 [Gemmata obscuriglobus]|uniref:hypothetical protein n=1 Tax=Gemmata obscuriglobus TaxID=114 RepID=UPI00016C4275|nr:hypothetical protein [Gemmata obscuriglobus]QEG26816.1 hypothetical protein GobsT_15630 [Gemmata obscuriglobus]VTS02738.1 unnamed protein product [Gemmata obscuriglobus UQM 2246]